MQRVHVTDRLMNSYSVFVENSFVWWNVTHLISNPLSCIWSRIDLSSNEWKKTHEESDVNQVKPSPSRLTVFTLFRIISSPNIWMQNIFHPWNIYHPSDLRFDACWFSESAGKKFDKLVLLVHHIQCSKVSCFKGILFTNSFLNLWLEESLLVCMYMVELKDTVSFTVLKSHFKCS